MNTPNTPDLIVSGQPDRSEVTSLAGALASIIRERGQCSLQAMGANAINKAVKAIIIANGYVSASGVEIIDRKYFVTVYIEGEERTAIRFNCQMVEKK